MDTEVTYFRLKNIAIMEFPDIVISSHIIAGPLNTPKSLRMFFIDDSFLEIWISGKKYSYHWQRRDKTLYRHDNAPHIKHKHLKTFPKHFHEGSENNVKESNVDDDPNNALRDFLKFIKIKLIPDDA